MRRRLLILSCVGALGLVAAGVFVCGAFILHSAGVPGIAQRLLAASLLLVLLACTLVMLLLARLRRSGAERTAAENRYRNIIAQVQECIVLADPASGRILEANAALLRATGYDAAQLDALRLDELVCGADADLSVAQASRGAALYECSLRTCDGGLLDIEITVSLLEAARQPLLCVVGRDLTLRRQVERQRREGRRNLSYLARHDSLTGLPNRLYLQSRLPRLLRRLSGSKRLLALLSVDIDHFKHINDSRDHARGDEVLKTIATRLRTCIRSADLVARTGGDEFVVVAVGMPDPPAVAVMAQNILLALQAPLRLQDGTVTLGASIGVALYPDDGIQMEQLLKHADIALYRAKEHGRNGYQFFSAGMETQLTERVTLDQELRHALDHGQLHVEYQPIVDLASGRLQSLEALCRWQHPQFGAIEPARFVPLAERSGLIVRLGEQVLHAVCRQLRTWQQEGVPLVPVAVNVSPLQLERSDFARTVREVTSAHGVEPCWLSFEIVESILLDDSDRHVETLVALRAMGSRISVDDFGAGYSSFSYLRRLPVDTLKIDRSFIRDMNLGGDDVAIIRGMVAMAHTLRLRIVAEGVETLQQRQSLLELGCESGQGYYFGRPAPATRCREVLSGSRDPRANATMAGTQGGLPEELLLRAQTG